VSEFIPVAAPALVGNETNREISHSWWNKELKMKTIVLAGGKGTRLAPLDGYWQDLGRPDDYEQAVQDFESLRQLILGVE
jgi:hypothetical protein